VSWYLPQLGFAWRESRREGRGEPRDSKNRPAGVLADDSPASFHWCRVSWLCRNRGCRPLSIHPRICFRGVLYSLQPDQLAYNVADAGGGAWFQAGRAAGDRATACRGLRGGCGSEVAHRPGPPGGHERRSTGYVRLHRRGVACPAPAGGACRSSWVSTACPSAGCPPVVAVAGLTLEMGEERRCLDKQEGFRDCCGLS